MKNMREHIPLNTGFSPKFNCEMGWVDIKLFTTYTVGVRNFSYPPPTIIDWLRSRAETKWS